MKTQSDGEMQKYMDNKTFKELFLECNENTALYITAVIKTKKFDNFPIFCTIGEANQVYF